MGQAQILLRSCSSVVTKTEYREFPISPEGGLHKCVCVCVCLCVCLFVCVCVKHAKGNVVMSQVQGVRRILSDLIQRS